MREPDVIVVGAGPVGLLAANLLGAAGISVWVVEKRAEMKPGSRAIGIMPPSLEILERVDLAKPLVERGVHVRTAVVHGEQAAHLGTVRFDDLPAPYPYLLSIPQGETERILRAGLARFSTVRLKQGIAAVVFRETADRAVLTLEQHGTRFDTTARFVLACDGDRSALREAVGITASAKRFSHAFLMGDFFDASNFGLEAHLFFTRRGAVESFPLPGGNRRWIIQTDRFIENPMPELITAETEARTGFRLDPKQCVWQSPFGIKTQLSDAFYYGRLLLAGDAAHVMPPIGGQGMNTGFADAFMAVNVLAAALEKDGAHPSLFGRYDTCRRRAASAAASRAALSMRIGTIRGTAPSMLRNVLIRTALRPGIATRLARRFSMWTLPCGTVDAMVAAMNGVFPPTEAP